jgi:hypothetical protein
MACGSSRQVVAYLDRLKSVERAFTALRKDGRDRRCPNIKSPCTPIQSEDVEAVHWPERPGMGSQEAAHHPTIPRRGQNTPGCQVVARRVSRLSG